MNTDNSNKRKQNQIRIELQKIQSCVVNHAVSRVIFLRREPFQTNPLV